MGQTGVLAYMYAGGGSFRLMVSVVDDPVVARVTEE